MVMLKNRRARNLIMTAVNRAYPKEVMNYMTDTVKIDDPSRSSKIS